MVRKFTSFFIVARTMVNKVVANRKSSSEGESSTSVKGPGGETIHPCTPLCLVARTTVYKVIAEASTSVEGPGGEKTYRCTPVLRVARTMVYKVIDRKSADKASTSVEGPDSSSSSSLLSLQVLEGPCALS